MRLGKKIAIGLLVLPLAEVAVFLLVAWAIGFLPAFGVMVLTSFAGCLVLHHAGRAQLSRFRRAVGRGEPARSEAGSAGLMVVLAGILLVLPGFITDLLGGLLLVPPVRRRISATIGRVIGGGVRGADRRRVIDLDQRDWREVPDEELPKPDGR